MTSKRTQRLLADLKDAIAHFEAKQRRTRPKAVSKPSKSKPEDLNQLTLFPDAGDSGTKKP